MVSGAVEAFSASSDLGEKMADRDIDLDFAYIFAESEKASFPLARWFLRRLLRKTAQGDLVATGKFYARCAQVQGALVLVESILILVAAYAIVESLGSLAA